MKTSYPQNAATTRTLTAGVLLLLAWACGRSLAQNAPAPTAAKHWTADNGNGTYSNPLFYEEFEDPDVIRVGEDYYLAGTTMHMNPAVSPHAFQGPGELGAGRLLRG